jgi:hypothetical protein
MLKFNPDGECTSFRSITCAKDSDCVDNSLWKPEIRQECGIKALIVHKCNEDTLLSFQDILGMRKEDSVKTSAYNDFAYRESIEISTKNAPDAWNVAVCQKETQDIGTNASVIIDENEASNCGGNIYATVVEGGAIIKPTPEELDDPDYTKQIVRTSKAWLALTQIDIRKGKAMNGGGLCLTNNIGNSNFHTTEISARLRGVTLSDNTAQENGGGVWHGGLVLALSGTKGVDTKISTTIGTMSSSDTGYCEARKKDADNKEIEFTEGCAKGLVGGQTTQISGNSAGGNGGGVYVVPAPLSVDSYQTQRAVLQFGNKYSGKARSMVDNVAGEMGGGIMFANVGGVVAGMYLTENNAPLGAGIAILGSSATDTILQQDRLTVNVQSSILTANTAVAVTSTPQDVQGAGVWAKDVDVNVVNSIVE